jgi:phage gpG-like protein
MAGVSVTITVDDAEVQAMLSRLVEFGGEPIQQALGDVGEALYTSTLERAALEESPDGVRWADLNPRYAKRKAKLRPGLPMLRFDNHMLGDMFSYQVGDGFVDIGTGAIYGARQQLGGGGITARPFLGESEQDATTLREILAEHLQGAIDGR